MTNNEKLAKLRSSGRYGGMALRLLEICGAEEAGKNVFLSPLSVLMLMAIASDATAGNTKVELFRLLGFPDPGEAYGALQEALCAGGCLSSANAVCVRQDLAPGIREPFRELLARVYGGEIFSSADMAEDVNAWISEKTKGMIREAAPADMGNMAMCLVNAVAFEDKWRTPYEDRQVRDGEFRNADGTVSTVGMMRGEEYEYIETSSFRGFTKDYRSGFYFLALLPKEEGSEALVSAVEGLSFIRLRMGTVRKKVYTRMPEFTFSYARELSPIFRELGVSELFTFGADFSPLLKGPRARVESILHRAFVDVNRQGTKAAAVTAMWAEEEGGEPEEYEEVYLDRPFVFMIMHKQTGYPVFTGIVSQLENREA